MHTIAIDLETYCKYDIRKIGGYKYAEECEILLWAYAIDNKPVEIVDLTQGEQLPTSLLAALQDNTFILTAYNAAFERTVINHYLARHYPAIKITTERWHCTMVQSFTLGLPGGLDMLGKVLKLSEDKQKMAVGKRLIQYFCKPCKPTKTNGGRTRNLPQHDIEKWNIFKEYCVRDVESERALRLRMAKFIPSRNEHDLWVLDQNINDRGVLVDLPLVENAITFDSAIKEKVTQQAIELTGIDNPNSVTQLLDWFEQVEGYRIPTLDKKMRKELLDGNDIKPKTRQMLNYKDLLSKTSVKKYQAMQDMACRDNRVRGMLQFYGAQRTGRWAGRGVQLHNLPQNHLNDLDDARRIIKAGDLTALEMLYDNPSDVLSQLIRTAFIAGKGKRFIVADFSAIEARVIAWIADEQWRMDVFAKGGDIYCASASQMFHVPVVKHGVNGHLRQKGKVAELACGYGGGVNALKAFGADKMGMTEAEMQDTITKWRENSPHICKLWRDLEDCAKGAIRFNNRVFYQKGIEFNYDSGFLFMRLPSGRQIAYVKPRVELEDAYGRETLTYSGVTTSGAWGRTHTWGGKLTENLVQATARDCLAVAMQRLTAAGYKIVMHVHDEVILEMPYGEGSLQEAIDIMTKDIPWAPGLLLNADGYETEYYKKD